MYDPNRPFRPYLIAAVENRAKDELKRRARQPTVNDPGLESTVGDWSIERQVDGPWRDPRVEEAVHTLSPDQRRALELKFVDSCPYPEIAVELSTSVVNARKLVSRGLIALTKALNKASGGCDD
jgi:RNA polymerase sigma factor (sigma-70 family)